MEDDKVFLSFEEFVGGWLGGISGLIASHPIDTMKVKLQQDKGSLMQVISATSKNEGITGFYKGIGFPAIMAGVQNAVFFGVYANVYRALKLATDSEINKILIAGCCGGFIQVLSTTPVEIIKIKLQTNKSKIGALKQPGILYTMKHIYALKGFRGFYHGFIPTAFRDVPSGGFYIGIYLSVDKYLQQYISSYWAHLLSGGLAGIFILFIQIVPSNAETRTLETINEHLYIRFIMQIITYPLVLINKT